MVASKIPEGVIATFHDSLDRCNRIPEFIDLFYERFLGSSPEIQARFEGVDLDRQKRMIKTSLYVSMLVADLNEAATSMLRRVADRHVELEISDHEYDLWMSSLLDTVKECDRSYSSEVEEAWKLVMSRGIEVMKEARHKANPEA